MEQILIGLLLGLFLERKNHETPQNERAEKPPLVLRYCEPCTQKEFRRQSDARWYPAVTDAMPQPDICQ